MKKTFYSLLILILLFAGCSSKQYFEPEDVVANVKFDKDLPAKIVDITRDGATLENGQVITKDGLLDVYLSKGFNYIGGGKDYIVGAADCGDIVVIDKKSKRTLFKKHFKFKKAVSANVDKNILALVFSNNEIMVYDIKSNKEIFRNSEDKIYSVDTRIATPFFLGDLILFPTLDGKIDIYDKNQNRVIRNIIVGTNKFLNNVIFLNVIGNRLIAATPNKVISVNPKNINSLDIDVSDVLFVEDGVYVLSKDGKIILTDVDLNILKSRKYPFAHFVGAIYGDKFIYLIEKEGYIIATDHDLLASNIFKLEDSVDDYIFTSGDKIFYRDKFFQLAK